LSCSKSNAVHLVFFITFLAACAGPSPAHPPTSAIPPTALARPTSTALIVLTPASENTPAIRFPLRDLIHDLRWSPDGSQLAVAAGTNIHIYAADGLREQHSLAVGVWTERLAFHPSEPILGAAAKDGSIRFWDTTSGNELCSFIAHPKGANSLAFQPNGNQLATTGSSIVSHLWDISSLLSGGCDVKEIADLIGASHTTPDVAFSADGQQFALVDIRAIRLRDSHTRKLIATLNSDLPIFDIALSADGRWLAAAQSAATVTLWDLTGKPTPTFTTLRLPAKRPQTYTWRVDFSSDSSRLAAGASDGALLVWEVAGPQPLFTRNLAHAISGLAFQPGTHRLAAGSLDGAVYFWDIK
jgi:WD40 repeat protein